MTSFLQTAVQRLSPLLFWMSVGGPEFHESPADGPHHPLPISAHSTLRFTVPGAGQTSNDKGTPFRTALRGYFRVLPAGSTPADGRAARCSQARKPRGNTTDVRRIPIAVDFASRHIFGARRKPAGGLERVPEREGQVLHEPRVGPDCHRNMTFAQRGLERPRHQPCIQRRWQYCGFDVTIDAHPVRNPRTQRAREHSDVQLQEFVSVTPGAKNRWIASGKDSSRNVLPICLLKQSIGADSQNPCGANRPTPLSFSIPGLDLLSRSRADPLPGRRSSPDRDPPGALLPRRA